MRKITASLLVTGAATLLLLLLRREAPETYPTAQKLRSEARAALDLFTEARAYPNATIPETGFTAAFDLARTRLAKPAGQADLQPWQAMGPDNIGGRTLALAFNPQNPNTIWAGSASGGLWRSTTSGIGRIAWEYIATGFPVLGVAAIAIAPDDSNTIYIGTGEVYGSDETAPGVVIRTTRGSYGIGILKSTDGGQSWRKSLDWRFNQRTGVQKIRINPQNPNSVWAATTEGIFRSRDAGESWQRVLDVVMATDIAINPVDTNRIFVACGGMRSPGHGLYRSTDGGVSWQQANLASGGGPVSFAGKAVLAISNSNPDIVMASIGNSDGLQVPSATWLCKTTDGGESWGVVSTVDYSTFQGWYSHAVAINPVNANEVWCAGAPFYPFRSLAGGTNLQNTEQIGLMRPASGREGFDFPDLNVWADYHDIVFHPTDPGIIYFANDGGVFRTTDGGRTSENCNGGYQTTQFYNGVSNSITDSAFVLGGMQDNLSTAFDGMPHWRRVGTNDGSWTAMNQANNNIVYLSFQGGAVFRYTNRGELFTNSAANITPPNRRAPINFIAPYVLSPVDNRTIYHGSAVVVKSTDEGQNWSVTNNGLVLDGNPVLSLAISASSTEVVYAATAPRLSRAGLFRTDNGGASWQNITGNLPNRYPTDIALYPNNDRFVVVTFAGFGTSHAFKSSDGGASWSDIGAGLLDLPTWAAVIDPLYPDHLYIGNDIGVFASVDGGATWLQFNDGLPDAVMAMDLVISPVNRKLRVATHGNGFFERPLLDPTTPTAPPEPGIPLEFTLLQNYPNPFNPSTTIRYYLEQPGPVTLTIYDAAGRQVRSLVAETQVSGWHRVSWDGRIDAGRLAPSGAYVYRLATAEQTLSRKLLLLR